MNVKQDSRAVMSCMTSLG